MNDEAYDDIALERSALELFGVDLEIEKVIVRNIDVGRSARATIFLSRKKQLFCYVHGPARLLLGDVKKIAARVGLTVELFFPPKGQPHYFDEVARAKFRDVFPGRTHVVDDDLTFYRTLAPYSPALLLVSEVRDGHLYCADSDARTGWRVAAKFAYRRIRTS